MGSKDDCPDDCDQDRTVIRGEIRHANRDCDYFGGTVARGK